jgi:small-conductance mechanosensitive channel
VFKRVWKKAGLRIVPCFLIAILGGFVASAHYKSRHTPLKDVPLAAIGIVAYLVFAFSFLQILTNAIHDSSKHRIGVRRASTIRFFIRIIGYIVILLGLLEILHISLSRILVGSALVGVILSVAAQQSLANFFASIVIIIDRPYSVGDHIVIVSGGLGGRYEGTVIDINFSHTLIKVEDGSIVRLPNAPILSASAVIDPAKQEEIAKNPKLRVDK